MRLAFVSLFWQFGYAPNSQLLLTPTQSIGESTINRYVFLYEWGMGWGGEVEKQELEYKEAAN